MSEGPEFVRWDQVDKLKAQNARLLAALEAVAADIGDDQSEAWVTPPVKRLVLAAIAKGDAR